MPKFKRTIGIDYSGAKTPTESLKGLRVYLAEGDAEPIEGTNRLGTSHYTCFSLPLSTGDSH